MPVSAVYAWPVVPSLVTRSSSCAGERLGADRCPGAVAIHRAEDGGLARIRFPGGALTRQTLLALAGWATELGNGRLELTARGNVQLRGLAVGAERELSTRLAERGLLPSLAHDRARNVLASPLSGRDGMGALDVRPLVAELDRRLCDSPQLAELPGRFLFALDDGRGDVAGLRADVAALALPDQWVALLLAGQDSGLRLPARDAVTGLLTGARAFLRRRAGDQRVWRVAELPGGPLGLVPELCAELGSSLSDQRADGSASVPRSGVVIPARDPYGPIGRIEQLDGRVALAVSVPLGELTPARCRLLAAVAEREVILTPWRGVVLPDLSPSVTERAARRLAGVGLVLDSASPALGVTACTGRPGCGKALADVRADASVAAGRSTGTALSSSDQKPKLPVHWSGCARRCGRPVDPVVEVTAVEGGYRVDREGMTYYVGSNLTEVRAAAARARLAR